MLVLCFSESSPHVLEFNVISSVIRLGRLIQKHLDENLA